MNKTNHACHAPRKRRESEASVATAPSMSRRGRAQMEYGGYWIAAFAGDDMRQSISNDLAQMRAGGRDKPGRNKAEKLLKQYDRNPFNSNNTCKYV
jgi:hypothetical protein